MQNPYVVGRWVRGDEHYDRQSLIEHLLHAHDTAIWVVGTRRMGKTSLLRQIEHVTAKPESPYVPLFWDLQGHATAEQLTEELCWAIEEVADRFAEYEIDWDQLHQSEAATILRRLCRLLHQQQQTLRELRNREALARIDFENQTFMLKRYETLRQSNVVSRTDVPLSALLK